MLPEPRMKSDLRPEALSRRLPPPDLIRALGRLRPEDVTQYSSLVLPLLTHPEPDVRAAALSTVFVLWRLGEHRQTALELLRNDRHYEVRTGAAYAIAATSTDTTRRDDLLLLLRTVDNGHESPEVRRAAYEAIMLICQRPDFPDVLAEFDPAADVDWSWIDELRSTLS
jgi:vesicle coat complex subunit